MTTNRDESQDLGRALRRRSENEVLSSGTVMSESRGDISGERYLCDDERHPEPMEDRAVDYEGGELQLESPSNNLREVNIKPLDSGYLVKVGCQSVAVETTETLLKALGDYLNNPDSFERAWYKNKNRSKL
jgi:hypothetical protein